MKIRKMIFCLGLILLAASGCEATKGAGKDLENTGANIQQGVNNAQTQSTYSY